MNIKQQLDMQARYTAQSLDAPSPAEPETFTPETILKMKRADVVEHLEAHGITEADCEGVKVADLRDMLANAIFTGL